MREEWCQCLDGSLTEGEKCLAFVCEFFNHSFPLSLSLFPFPPPPVLLLASDDSDKLADLLMKIVDGYTKAPNIKIPQIPPNLDTERLAVQYTTALKALTSQVLS